MEQREPGFEHQALKGITIKNMIVTIICTASIVISVMTTYFNLKSDIADNRYINDTQNKIFELRLKIAEAQIGVIQQQVQAINESKK